MTDSIIIEVVGGPMDGLLCELSNEVTIGRNVGNTLSITFDNMSSGRHAQIISEGGVWCLRDLNSLNGTYYRNSRLEVNRSVPLEENQPFLIGTTVIRMIRAAHLKNSSVITNEMLKDPREVYSMTPSLEEVWERIYNKGIENGAFCDVGVFTRELAAVLNSGKVPSLLDKIVSPAGFDILGTWLSSMFSFVPDYRLVNGCLTVSPRLWQVMRLGMESSDDGVLGEQHLYDGIRKEGRSLVALYMKRDKEGRKALEVAFKKNFKEPCRESPLIESSSRPQEAVTPEKRETLNFSDELISCETGSAPDTEIFKFSLRMEQLIFGFLKDAKVLMSGKADNCLPGFNMTLSQIIKSGDRDLEHQYLNLMYQCLAAILAGQQAGYGDYGKRICSRLEDSMDDTREYGGGNLFRSKNKGMQKVVNTIYSTLTRLESEGLGEEIVREKIRENIARVNQDQARF